MSDQSTWPAHMRDDAPTAVCSSCGRKTVAPSEFRQACNMPQPDGSRCAGRFSDPIRISVLTTELNQTPGFPEVLLVCGPDFGREQEFRHDLQGLLNRTGMDSECGTPDFILADLIVSHLRALRHARLAVAQWEGRTIKQVGA